MPKPVAFVGLDDQKQRLRHQLEKRILDVISHGQFIMGPEVGELEKRLSTFCGSKYSISVANGTDALQIALMAAGIGRGDGVLVPSFTYTATAEAILILGAHPIFVDVDPITFNIDTAKLGDSLLTARKAGLNPRAIIAVDLFGLPADWDFLNLFAQAEKLFLVSDAAQSFGAATAVGKRVGTLAPVTTTSFFPAKPLGCYGDGGAIFTDDDDLAEVIKSIRVHGQGKAKYETVRVGMNSRLDTIQAAVLLTKLDVFEDEIKARNTLADAYGNRLSSIVQIPQKPPGVVSAWAQYTIKVKERDRVQVALKAEGVPTAVYYPLPMHLQKAYERWGGGPGSLHASEMLSQQVLSLPMNPYWTKNDLETVVQAVYKVIS